MAFEAIGGNVLTVPESGTATCRAGGEWRESGTPGFMVRPLLEDAACGLRTWLMKTLPGVECEFHAHDEIEQVYVIEGEVRDDEAIYGPGDYFVRAPGARHATVAGPGSLSLVIYSRARGEDAK